jgi:hypothetical protein
MIQLKTPKNGLKNPEKNQSIPQFRNKGKRKRG